MIIDHPKGTRSHLCKHCGRWVCALPSIHGPWHLPQQQFTRGLDAGGMAYGEAFALASQFGQVTGWQSRDGHFVTYDQRRSG